jgi:glucose/arabinose dehydrogenase
LPSRVSRSLFASWPILGLALFILAIGGGSAAVGCKLAWDCRGRDLPLIERFFEDGELAGIERRGTGQTVLPRGFVQEAVVTDLKLPTAFTRLPDGRLLIAEKAGIVKIARPGDNKPKVILDLRREVDEWSYNGLLDIEARKDFTRTGHVYLLYSHDDERGDRDVEGIRTVRVTRVTMTHDSIAKQSEHVIVGSISKPCNDQPPGSDCIPLESAHSGGALRFAADGNLFISTGDGSGDDKRSVENALRAQDLDSLAGKVLRITPEGEGVPSNPFWTGNPDDARSKIWSYGLRNPFRFDVRPQTNELYIGDVGFNLWEEINVIDKPGLNLGWPCYEGNIRSPVWKRRATCRRLYGHGRAAVRFPLVAYPHASVTGGAFYVGQTWPAAFRGAYIYGDWMQNWLRYLSPADDARTVRAKDFAEDAAGPVEFRAGPDGDLYYVALNLGQIRRISYRGP